MIKGFLRCTSVVATAAVLGAFVASPAAAQSNPDLDSGIQIQNLSASEANATISFYADGATPSATLSQTIAANDQITLFPREVADLQENFSGSAVISSDQQVSAVVNVDGDSLEKGASYTGQSQGSTSLGVPLVFNQFFGFTTRVSVQNIGTEPTDVTLSYNGQVGQGDGATPFTGDEPTVTIQPGAAFIFDQGASQVAPANFNGAATVSSSTSDVVATVLEIGAETMSGYNAFASGTTNPLLPLVNINNFGYLSGVPVQNVGTEATEVTVSFTPATGIGEGTACTETRTIAPGGVQYFANEAFDANEGNNGGTDTCVAGETFIGSAAVTTNTTSQPLVALVSQLNQDAEKSGTFGGFSAEDASGTVVLSIINDRNFGFGSGFSMVNVGDAPATVTCTYSNSDATQSETIPAGGTWTITQDGVIGDTYNGSGVCTAAESGAQLLAVVNQANNADPDSDTLYVYEGVNN